MASINLWTMTGDQFGTIDPNKFCVEPKVNYLFGFSGNGNHKEETTTGFIGFGNKVVGLKNDGLVGSQKDFKVIAVQYDKDEDGVGRLSPSQHRLYAISILMPFFTDENFKRFSINEALSNANRITFSSYCAGSIEIGKIINELKGMMSYAKYSEKEIDQILGNIWHISYAPQILKSNKNSVYMNTGLKTVRFMGLSDALFGEEYKKLLGKEINGIEIRRADDVVEVFFSRLLNTANPNTTKINDHWLSTLMKNSNWENVTLNEKGKWIVDENVAPVRKAISDMLGFVTAKAMARGINNKNCSVDSMVDCCNAIKNDYSEEKLKVYEP